MLSAVLETFQCHDSDSHVTDFVSLCPKPPPHDSYCACSSFYVALSKEHYLDHTGSSLGSSNFFGHYTR